MAAAVENVVRGYLHQRNVQIGAGAAHLARRSAIDPGGQRHLRLGPIDIGERTGVDDCIRARGPDCSVAGPRNAQIGLRPVETGHVAGEGGQLPRDLAGFAEHQDHARLPKPVPNRAPTPSRVSKGRHHASFSRYHRTVFSNPSSNVTEGRHPSSVLMRDGSMA